MLLKTHLHRSVANGIQYVKEDKRTKYVLWSALVILILWLAFDIGILQAIACLVGWALMWVIYSTLKNFIRPNKTEPEPDPKEAFYINFRSMLSESEQYDLLWLANAITLPISYDTEHYYYDGLRKELFYTISSKANPFLIGVLNKFDLEYSDEIASDIAVRLELINDESSKIVEIPRLDIQEKIGVQLEFLSYMAGTLQHNELIAVVEGQQDDYKFILDTILMESENTLPMIPYWSDFKLKVTFTYINKTIGVDLQLLK
jgi:hypothetical protein